MMRATTKCQLLAAALLLAPSLAVGRFAAPNLDLSISEADTVIVGTVVTSPTCVGVVCLHHMDHDD